ncbi:MAG: O-antigen ligase family protein [Lachnospira sp.]|nr:O-antigen ligase family protein [Lachnospira sp.]
MKSKYIKDKYEKNFYSKIAWLFLFAIYVLPQYFGFHLAIDFTAQRIMLIIVLFIIFTSQVEVKRFTGMIMELKHSIFIGLYIFVTLYTLVLRADISAFLNPFIEFLILFTLIYLIKTEYGADYVFKWIIRFIYFLLIMGVIEYLLGESLFAKLETIKGLYTGAFVRSGSYRIMGPAIHSLGYGLMLVTMTPFVVFDYKNNRIDFLLRKGLLILLIVNVFLCGSRSTLSILFFELLALFIFSSKEHKRRFGAVFVPFILIMIVVVFLTQNMAFGRYVMLQITSIIDEGFGTNFSVNYGADSALAESSNYRAQLYDIFKLKWLNPLVGIGRKRSFGAEINGSYVYSVDNYYICEYIRYAYPGLFSYILIIFSFLKDFVKKIYRYKDPYCIVLFVGVVSAYANLFWIDSLMNLKYIYILFALFICRDCYSHPLKEVPKEDSKLKTNSKYIKKSVLY